MTDGYHSLTDKEKQTLRLILCGHDAKSMASELELSVHTVNERLRNARRKLAVTSSKEAARVLLEEEGTAPETSGDKGLGEAEFPVTAIDDGQPEQGTKTGTPLVRIIGGLSIMSLLAATLAFLVPSPDHAISPNSKPGTAAASQTDVAAESAARDWLALVDAGDWEGSWNGTARSFRDLNTPALWSETAQGVHGQLGAALSRVLEAQEDVPAPPNGYRLVKFRTQFANRADVVETLSLVREDGEWKIAGIYIS